MNNSEAVNSQYRHPVLEALSINKTFINKRARTEVLKQIKLKIEKGEALAIVGPSGAGKSTLLHILGTLDRPTSGTIAFSGEDITGWDQKKLAEFRNKKIGFVFQFHHLLPEFNALENTMMPALVSGVELSEAEAAAFSILKRMGLENRLKHKSGELSGGEQQRVAVARSLIMSPEVLFADEPTGNLDTNTGMEVFDLLLEVNAELAITLVLVTHNREFSSKLPRCITMVDGSIV